MMRFLFAIAFFCFANSAICGSADDAFQKLLNLEGVWEGKYQQYDMKLTYQPISEKTAVMEIMESAGTTMTTIYHKYGEKLMATHYCRFENQPRLVADTAGNSGNQLDFHFLDGTNLGKSYMSDVAFKFIDDQHMEQTTKFHGHDTVAKVIYTKIK